MMSKSQEFEDLLTETKKEAILQSKGRLDKPERQEIPRVEVISIVDGRRGLKFLEKSIVPVRPDSVLKKLTVRYFLLDTVRTGKWKSWVRRGDRGWDESGQLYVVTALVDVHPFWEKVHQDQITEREVQMLELLEKEMLKKVPGVSKTKPVEPDYSKIPDIFK